MLPTIGFVMLVRERSYVPGGWLVIVAPALFLFGVALGAGRRVPGPGTDGRTANLRPALVAMAWVLGALAIIHFSSVGVPLFSSSIETSRFDVGSSGLGGFPSRAVLYGLPIAALGALATHRAETHRVTVALWLMFTVTQVFLGFKGGLVEVVLITTLGVAIRFGRLSFRQLRWVGLGGLVAGGYITLVGTRYQTLAGGGSGLDYILRRSTSDAIIAGYTALTARPVGIPADSSVFLRDFGVLLGRYLGTAPEGHSFDELVSAVVTGTPLQRGAFLVPVTVGGPVYLLYSVPVILAALILIAIGVVWSVSIRRLQRASSVTSLVTAAVMLYALRVFLMNGNGAYLLINLGFTLFLLLSSAGIGVALHSQRLAHQVSAARIR